MLPKTYHLSHEAIAGISEFRIPREFNNLFNFQKAAVQLAARHVTRRGGVIVGDVVGLGKTLVGTALAKILQEDCFLETLIICPKNLTLMWQEYVDTYRLYAKVMLISKVQNLLPELRRYQDDYHSCKLYILISGSPLLLPPTLRRGICLMKVSVLCLQFSYD